MWLMAAARAVICAAHLTSDTAAGTSAVRRDAPSAGERFMRPPPASGSIRDSGVDTSDLCGQIAIQRELWFPRAA